MILKVKDILDVIGVSRKLGIDFEFPISILTININSIISQN